MSTPLPVPALTSILLLQFSNAIIITSPFAYLPFFIRVRHAGHVMVLLVVIVDDLVFQVAWAS